MQHYKDGIHAISNTEYHASAGISRSMLMDLKRSPYHYWYNHLSGLAVKEEATPAMNLGNAVHTLVLEEHKFKNEFFITTQQTRPRRGTPPFDKMLEEANGRIILTPDELMQAELMAQSVKGCIEAKALLEGCTIEQSIYFTDATTGIQCKARPDALAGAIVIDLKTTADASMSKFQSSAMNYGYFLQAAMIHRAMASVGKHMDNFVFICVEKEAPYSVAVYVLEQDALDYGLQQYDNLMQLMRQCMDKNEWPSYGIQNIGLPSWAKYDDLNLEI